jgi:hypothetical protein
MAASETSDLAPAEPEADGELEGEQGLPVGPDELNAWRRGFTPQAEIWNGRLAMLGISMGIAALLLIRLVTHP